MDLLQLKYFLESAKNENFTKTANSNMVPTSSVSAAIKRLEDDIGVKLFDRKANKIFLNRDGKTLADALSESFKIAEDAICEIQGKEKEKKDIKLLVYNRRVWITDLLIKYRKQNPNFSFRISHDISLENFSDFDIIIDGKTDKYKNYNSFILSNEEIKFRASRDSHLAGKKLTLKDLQNEPFIFMSKGSALRKVMERCAEEKGIALNVAIEISDRQCLLNCVNEGLGITLSAESAESDTMKDNFVNLDVVDFCERQTVFVHHREPLSSEKEFKGLLDFLSEHATR